MYTCFAIDDEFTSLKILTHYIESQPELELIKAFTDPILALNEIEKLKKVVDIIFLDVEMPGMNGIELAKLIKHKTKKLVFTTSFSNYAINSYELEADGFLLKPILPAKFDQTIKKLCSGLDFSLKNYEDAFIVVKSTEQRNRFIKIRITDIIVVEAKERTTKIYTKEEIITSNSSLAEVSELLAFEKTFHRIHRSFIISANHVKTLERTFVILTNSLKISIGRKYAELYHKLSKNRRLSG